MTTEQLARKIIETIDAYGDNNLETIKAIETIAKRQIDVAEMAKGITPREWYNQEQYSKT